MIEDKDELKKIAGAIMFIVVGTLGVLGLIYTILEIVTYALSLIR